MSNNLDFNPYQAPQVTEHISASKSRRPIAQIVFFVINFGVAIIVVFASVVTMFLERRKPGFLTGLFGVAIVLVVFVSYAVTELRVFLKRTELHSSLGFWNIVCGLGLFISGLLAAFIELREQPNQSFWSRFALYGPLMLSAAYAVACGCYRVTRSEKRSDRDSGK